MHSKAKDRRQSANAQQVNGRQQAYDWRHDSGSERKALRLSKKKKKKKRTVKTDKKRSGAGCQVRGSARTTLETMSFRAAPRENHGTRRRQESQKLGQLLLCAKFLRGRWQSLGSRGHEGSADGMAVNVVVADYETSSLQMGHVRFTLSQVSIQG